MSFQVRSFSRQVSRSSKGAARIKLRSRFATSPCLFGENANRTVQSQERHFGSRPRYAFHVWLNHAMLSAGAAGPVCPFWGSTAERVATRVPQIEELRRGGKMWTCHYGRGRVRRCCVGRSRGGRT